MEILSKIRGKREHGGRKGNAKHSKATTSAAPAMNRSGDYERPSFMLFDEEENRD